MCEEAMIPEEKEMGRVEEVRGVLEEIQAAAAEASASIEERLHTPMEKFTFWLRELGNCGSFRVSLVSLERDKADVMAADTDEAFHSKAKCQAAAQKQVDQAVREARKKLEQHMGIVGELNFIQSFQGRFDHQLDILRENLELMRTPDSAAVVDEMESYLIASAIHKKAKEIHEELAPKYQLKSAGAYYSEIVYDEYDPSESEEGLAKLIAKGFIRHGFNCYEAIRVIEENAQAALKQFQEDFNAQIQEEVLVGIVEPIQRLLPQLRAKETQLSA